MCQIHNINILRSHLNNLSTVDNRRLAMALKDHLMGVSGICPVVTKPVENKVCQRTGCDSRPI